MIRLALPKGRNLEPALAALRAADLPLDGFEPRRLRQSLPGERVELLLLKDWDLPLYVEHGIADGGFVGSDVLEELGTDLLVPARLRDGRSRFSLIGRDSRMPAPGDQIRVATKYPRFTQRLLAHRPWGIEIVRLSGSVELAPLLDLAELAVDIVQTGQTLRDHDLHEVEILAPVAPCLVVNRASFQRLRVEINELIDRLERAEVVGP
jgi:ATP phosphoribosyltransferase